MYIHECSSQDRTTEANNGTIMINGVVITRLFLRVYYHLANVGIRTPSYPRKDIYIYIARLGQFSHMYKFVLSLSRMTGNLDQSQG